MKAKEAYVGSTTSAEVAAAPGAAKDVAARAVGAEKAALQAIIDEKRVAEKAATATWEHRRAL
eukprot:7111590-Prymnesium_polylepis.1